MILEQISAQDLHLKILSYKKSIFCRDIIYGWPRY